MEGIASVFLIIGFIIYFKFASGLLEHRIDNYDYTKTDSIKMLNDKVNNNLSNAQVGRNMVNGKYDKR